MTDIQEKLDEAIPPHFISERAGLSYVTGAYVKNRLNEVFGWDGWFYAVEESKLLSLDEKAVRWYAHVKLIAGARNVDGDRGKDLSTARDGIAIGHGTMRDRDGNPLSVGRQNEVIDFAAAEAVTDALKRAAVSLGNSLGLQLYPMSKNAPEPERDVIAEIPIVKDFANAIAQCSDIDVLKSIGQDIGAAGLSASSRGGLHDLYIAKRKELEG